MEGVTRPGTSRRLVHTGIDFWPTLSDYAGIAVPDGLPGLSLKTEGAVPREYIVVSDHHGAGRAPVNARNGELNGTSTLQRATIRYSAYSSEGERRESLVDLEKDPGETINLARDPTFAAVLKQHRELLAKWCKKFGDDFPLVT